MSGTSAEAKEAARVRVYFETLITVLEACEKKSKSGVGAKKAGLVTAGVVGGSFLLGPVGAIVGGVVAGSQTKKIKGKHAKTFKEILETLRYIKYDQKVILVAHVEQLTRSPDPHFIQVYVNKSSANRDSLMNLVITFMEDMMGYEDPRKVKKKPAASPNPPRKDTKSQASPDAQQSKTLQQPQRLPQSAGCHPLPPNAANYAPKPNPGYYQPPPNVGGMMHPYPPPPYSAHHQHPLQSGNASLTKQSVPHTDGATGGQEENFILPEKFNAEKINDITEPEEPPPYSSVCPEESPDPALETPLMEEGPLIDFDGEVPVTESSSADNVPTPPWEEGATGLLQPTRTGNDQTNDKPNAGHSTNDKQYPPQPKVDPEELNVLLKKWEKAPLTIL